MIRELFSIILRLALDEFGKSSQIDDVSTPIKTNKRATAVLNKLSFEATDCTILHSLSYGDLEAWNLATCYLQNAEMDGVSVINYMESALSYESDSVQSYFRALGFRF